MANNQYETITGLNMVAALSDGVDPADIFFTHMKLGLGLIAGKIERTKLLETIGGLFDNISAMRTEYDRLVDAGEDPMKAGEQAVKMVNALGFRTVGSA